MHGLDSLVDEAARLLGVPVAWVGLIGEGGEEILAATGTKTTHIPRGLSFASRLNGGDVLVVPDARLDSRFSGHPMVVEAPHVSFIATAAVIDASGRILGALSAVDTRPHTLSPERLEMLRTLGRLTAGHLSMRDDILDERERFRDFFEQTRDLLLSIGADGTVVHANETAAEILGVQRGSPLRESVEEDRRAEFDETLQRVFTRNAPERMETTFTTRDGARISLEGWLMPKVVAGAAVMARVVFRDVTDRKQFETELANARDAALEAARTKNTFMANVSHEIRTPMNGVIGMLDLLLASKLDAEQQDFAHQARASAEQLLSLVSNILYISNLEAGSRTAARVAFDLQRSLLRIIEVMKIAALGKDVAVRFSYDASLPTILRGNPSKVRQIVTNLIENAVRFTEEGEVALSVSLETETDTHHVIRFEVRDTGIGIAEENRLLLFERFSQLDTGTTRGFSGAGLGLATARQLVETMGGLIDVDSTPGQGSTFWFTIPFRKEALGRRPIASSDFELAGRRVLLLDRHADTRRLALHYLGSTWQMRAEAATTGAEAVAAMQAAANAGDPFQLIVFETVPDLDAAELAREVRRHPRACGAGLVQLVPMSDLVNEAELRAAGIDAWTFKPIGQRELFDSIAIAVARDAIALPRSIDANAAPTSPAEDQTVPRPEPGQLKILLVEDNFLNMKLTVSQLRKLGYDPETVVNGSEALAAVRRRRYDVILMDCQMPVMDGYEATAEIRRLERGGAPRHRIIAMTANALEGDRERCLAAGMDDYLAKPTNQREIERALERFFTAAVAQA